MRFWKINFLCYLKNQSTNWLQVYGKKIFEILKREGFRVELNDANETLGKRIREAELQKIPYILVVGEKEKKNKTLNVRHFGRGQEGEIEITKFIQKLKKEIGQKII